MGQQQQQHGHYRKVRPKPWGEFVIDIHDSTSQGGCLWLGTFDTTLEATLAYDNVDVAFRLPWV
jgi:hypothetical protein